MVPFNLEKPTSPIVVMPKLKISLQSLSKGLISSFELAKADTNHPEMLILAHMGLRPLTLTGAETAPDPGFPQSCAPPYGFGRRRCPISTFRASINCPMRSRHGRTPVSG